MDGGPITNIDYLELQNNTVAPTANPGGVYYLNGEWYLITDAGAIQVTDGGGLNTTINGGIAGDYGGTNPASVRFVDATQRYDFYDDFAGGAWGYLRARGFDIAAGATSSIRARLAFTGAANLTFTFPADLPASNRSVVTVDSAGQMSHNSGSTTITNDIVLSGTARVKHGEQTITYTFYPHETVSGTWTAVGANGYGFQTTVAGTARFHINGIQVGWRVKSASVRTFKTGTGTTTLSMSTGVGGTTAANYFTVNDATAGARTVTGTVPGGFLSANVAGQQHFIEFTTGNNNDIVYAVDVTYDIP